MASCQGGSKVNGKEGIIVYPKFWIVKKLSKSFLLKNFRLQMQTFAIKVPI